LSPRRKDPDESLLDIIERTPASDGATWPPAGGGWPPGQWPPAGGGDRPGGRGGGEQIVALHEAAQEKYLNYALSVITSRALPDVRDGLKPVQRRILFTMWQQNLTADQKFRKCAKVVGDVMGSYHPHGDTAIYDTLVRMAQAFSLRYPLVDGSGNFGSLDGDAAAAMRYTECRLARIADEMLEEIDQDTVPFRPNYDGTKTEPVILPARLPNLLVNGATGIAVGMATSIPPHHLGEVCTALLKLLDNADLTLSLGESRSATLSVIKATEEITEFAGDDMWTSVALTWGFGHNHDLMIKFGQERGGIVCSSGICIYEPPFTGVRMVLSSRL